MTVVMTDTADLARCIQREIIRLGGINPFVRAASNAPQGYVWCHTKGPGYLIHAPAVLAEWADRPDGDWRGDDVELEPIAEDVNQVWDEEYPSPGEALHPLRYPDDVDGEFDPWGWVVEATAADGSTVYGWTLSRDYRDPDDFRRYPHGIRFETPGDAEEDAWEHGWQD